MIVSFCPSCQARLSLPEGTTPDRWIKCPKCDNAFQLSSPSASTTSHPLGPTAPDISAAAAVQIGTSTANQSTRQEDDDQPRKPGRIADDEEDDNWLRRLRRDNEEDDDRPRSRRRYEEDDEEVDDRPRNRRRYEEDDVQRGKPIKLRTWRKLLGGIERIYQSNLWYLAAAALCQAGFLLALSAFITAENVWVAGIIALIGILVAALAGLVGTVFKLIGYAACLQSPRRHGAKTLMTVSLVLAVLTFVFNFARAGSESIGNISSLCQFGEWVCLAFYMRALAQGLKASKLAKSNLHLAIASCCFFVIVPVIFVIAIIAVGVGFIGAAGQGVRAFDNVLAMLATLGIIMIVLALVFIGGCLVMFSWFMRNLVRLKNKLASTVGERSEGGNFWIVLLIGNGVLFLLLAGTLVFAIVKLKDKLPANPQNNNPFVVPNGPANPNAADHRKMNAVVKVGMTENEVRQALGQPIIILQNAPGDGPGTTRWQYGGGAVVFRAGKVTKVGP
jgi:hypothetical protein